MKWGKVRILKNKVEEGKEKEEGNGVKERGDKEERERMVKNERIKKKRGGEEEIEDIGKRINMREEFRW